MDGRVLALGSANADYQFRVAPGQPTSLRRGTSLLRTSGGKGANVAVFARGLGIPAELWACVGRDDLAEQALAGPRRAGVGLEHVRRVDEHTGLACIEVDERGDKSIVLIAGANEAWVDDAPAVFTEIRAGGGADVLVVALEVPVEIASAAVRAGRDRAIPVVVDPSPPDRTTPDVLRGTHVVPNHEEAEQLTGITVEGPESAARAAAALCAQGALAAYVKLAHGGCVVATADVCRLVEPPEVEAVDATGAGDAFAAATASALLHGADPVDAARHGVAGSTVAVQAYGSQESYPDRQVLDEALARVTVTAVRPAAPASSP